MLLKIQIRFQIKPKMPKINVMKLALKKALKNTVIVF